MGFGNLKAGVAWVATVASLMPFGLVSASLVSASLVNAATATIDINTKYQKISGFGASSAWNSINAVENELLFDTTSGAGLSLLRLRVDESAAPAKSLISSNSNQEQIKIAKAAMAKGAKIWATPWAPPSVWQTHPAQGKHTFNMEYASQWAKMLADYVVDMKAAGVPLIALSAQNEPDGEDFNHMTPEVVRSWIKDYLGPAMKNTGVPIMAPEKVNWCGFKNYLDAILDDKTTSDYVPIIAIHEYGCSPAAYPQIAAAGKEFWQTEIYESINVEDAGMNSALNTAKLIHESMVIANTNAWHYWWIHGGHATGLFLNGSSSPTKRVWIMGNYSRFVRPGYKRIDATTAPTDGVTLSAYASEKEDKIAIVILNTNNSSITQTFALKNVEPTQITPWVTDGSNDLKAQNNVQFDGNTFTYNIPARSVTTLVVQIGEVEPPPPPGPFNGEAAKLPGKIEIENYNVGGEGVSYHDEDRDNKGGLYREEGVDIVAVSENDESKGYAVGYTNAGEWLEYTVNVEKSGDYDWTLNYASSDSVAMHIVFDGKDSTAVVHLPGTGGWDVYQNFSGTSVKLSEGEHKIRMVMDKAYGNYNWVEFKEVTSQNLTSPIRLNFTPSSYVVYNSLGMKVTEGMNLETIKKTLKSGVYLVRNKVSRHTETLQIRGEGR